MRRTLLVVATLCMGCREQVVVDAVQLDKTTTTEEKVGHPNVTRAEASAVGMPTAEQPVVASAAARPSVVMPGDMVTLAVHLKIAPAWHIYGLRQSGGPGQPTRLELVLPEGVEAAGEWEAPNPDLQIGESSPVPVYYNEATFLRPLRVLANASPGPAEATCVVTYQACDRSQCLLPAKATIAIQLEISREKE